MSEPFIGEIRMFGGNFAPRGWAFCNGQMLSIAQNTALFSLLGTMYGGDGRTTFALPDMRGRAPIHQGQGPGLSQRPIGAKGGTEKVLLSVANLPSHTHLARANSAGATQPSPAGNVPATTPGPSYQPAPDGGTQMNPNFIAPSGGGQGHPNMQPFLAVSFIIALEGIFPSRN
jgi:microcystin-dependent protein